MYRVPEECPQEIEQLIQRCKLVDPKQRPSAREVFDILKRNCIVKRLAALATWLWKQHVLSVCW